MGTPKGGNGAVSLLKAYRLKKRKKVRVDVSAFGINNAVSIWGCMHRYSNKLVYTYKSSK